MNDIKIKAHVCEPNGESTARAEKTDDHKVVNMDAYELAEMWSERFPKNSLYTQNKWVRSLLLLGFPNEKYHTVVALEKFRGNENLMLHLLFRTQDALSRGYDAHCMMTGLPIKSKFRFFCENETIAKGMIYSLFHENSSFFAYVDSVLSTSEGTGQ